MTEIVRWGILGTAKIARQRVVPAIQAVSEATVYAVASRDEARARAFAQDCGAPAWHATYQELIDDEKVDAVYVPLPNALHGSWARAAIAAGKPVLCEKPLTTGSADTAELVEYADSSGVLLAEGFMYRHHPNAAKVAELLSAGAIGRPVAARGALSFVLSDPADIRASPALGGGALLDLGCYVADALCRLYGGPAQRAEGVRLVGQSGVDEHVTAVLWFPGDRVGVVDCSFRLPWIESVFEIRGEEGTIRVPHAFNPGRSASALTLTKQGGKATQFDLPPCDMFAAMFAAFSRGVLGLAPYPYPARLSVATAQTMDLLTGLSAQAAGQ